MIIDFHTHIFPPEVRDHRDEYSRRDPTFGEMYGDQRAKMATAEELLRSMDEGGIDVSVGLGFAWQEPDVCVRHNDYLLDAAVKSGGRIIPFCTVNMACPDPEKEIQRCAAAGARGLGELRPENQGWHLTGMEGDRLAAVAEEMGLVLLFHVSEPVGHSYAGRRGLDLADFFTFCFSHRNTRKIGAHLGGGLPFYASNHYVAEAISDVCFDTAAQPYIYGSTVFDQVQDLIGPKRILFGSDFPLISQRRQMEEIQAAIRDQSAQSLVLGGNAARLLGLHG